MAFETPEYVEIGPRIYAVELVEPYAWDFDGLRCHVAHARQTIYLNGAVPEDDRADLLRRAADRVMRRCPHWRSVPILGTIS
jgi:hypothetical protein